jgi:N utilization substance protein B
MLNRRYLRIKVMQALYAFYQSKDNRLDIAEKNLFKSIENIYELFIYQLSIIVELAEYARKRAEENKQKLIPTPEDLNPNMRFIENQLIKKIANNKTFLLHSNNFKINWSDEQEIFRSLYNKIKESKAFKDYMNSSENSFEADKKIVISIFRKFIISDDVLQNYFEDKNIYWSDDYIFVALIVLKTLESIKSDSDEMFQLPELYKKSDDINSEDRKYTTTLFRKTVLNSEKYDEFIAKAANNWEVERIAIIDNIIIKMALTEMLECPTIPVKASLNEYIEIAKAYSSDKSRIFINGVLDKIHTDLKSKNLIKKIGRGLIDEN